MRTTLISLAALASMCFAGLAHAQQAAPANAPAATADTGAAAPVASETEGGRRGFAACRADLQSLCGTAAKGRERMECLRSNLAKASPECQAAVTARADAVQDRREACRGDAKALCGKAERGEGGLMTCLKANMTKLSVACSAALASNGPRNPTQ